MKLTRLLTIAFLLLAAAICAAPARANQSASGWCEAGAQSVIFGGITSTSKVQASYPSCTVTVYIHGGGLATIYSDSSGTPLSNPFTAGSNGQWTFFAANGIYDVNLSGAGITPTTISSIQLYDCVTAGCSGGGSGGVVQPGPQYSLPIYPNTPSQANVGPSNITTDSGKNTLNVPGDVTSGASVHPKGPAPYADFTQWGVRALKSITAIPAVPGMTATINSGTNTATVSTSTCASQTSSVCFVNGDGVDISGAGATNTMSTPSAPTVTPYQDQSGTGTGSGVAAPAGSTTFNYKVLACDIGGGCTAVSPAGTTTTGNTLGAQSMTVTSITRSNATLTFVTGSAPPLSVGTRVHVDGCAVSDNLAGFCGWFNVSTVTGTGFTAANTNFDTRNGAATTSSGGGTAYWFNSNHVTWTAVTGAFRYIIQSDRQTPGTFVNIGMSWPNDPTAAYTDMTLSFDDFGQTMMANSASSIPWYVPTNGLATNDLLTTTITSGAGTTSLVLAANATNSVSGATIVFTDQPNILAANNANVGSLMFPVGSGTYLTNEPMYVSASTNPFNQWIFSGAVQFNDTVLARPQWTGAIFPANTTAPQFSSSAVPKIAFGGNPGLLITGAGGTASISGLALNGAPNAIDVMQDGAGGAAGPIYTWDQFNGASGSADYMSMGFVGRGVTASSFDANFGDILLYAGTQGQSNQSSTPGMFFDNAGQVRMGFVMGEGRSTFDWYENASGGLLYIGAFHIQGPVEPIVTLDARSNYNDVALGYDGQSIIDTGVQSTIYNAGAWDGNIRCGPGGCGAGASGMTARTGAQVYFTTPGYNTASAYDGIFGIIGGTAKVYPNLVSVGAASTGNNYPIFVASAIPAAPTCSVSAGGSVAVGTYTFIIAPVWWNGGEGQYSAPSASCSTTTGNQTITINWSAIPGNPKGINLYDSNGGGYGAAHQFGDPLSGSATSFVWSAALTFNDWISSTGTNPAGGPTMLAPGVQGVITTKVTTPVQQSNFLYSAAGTPVPTCNAAALGEELIVSDATAPTYMAAYTSGGAITAKVLCSYNGSSYSWLTH